MSWNIKIPDWLNWIMDKSGDLVNSENKTEEIPEVNLDDNIKYKYYDNPKAFLASEFYYTKCDICNKTKWCFDASSFYWEEELSAVCEECLSSTKIQKKFSTCSWDIDELRKQLMLNLNWISANDIEKLVKEKTYELETTTPLLITWQDWVWPVIEWDYAKFIGFGSIPLYNELSWKNNFEEFFLNSLYYEEDKENELLILQIPKTEIRNYDDSNKYNTLFYVFKSLKSDKIVTMWDSS